MYEHVKKKITFEIKTILRKLLNVFKFLNDRKIESQNKTPLKKDWSIVFLSLKFIYSEKATKFFEISTLLLTTVHTVKSKVKISQNFEAFSKYMNFKENIKL